DGEWGRGSQTAYEAFLSKKGWPDSNRSAALLTMLTANALEEDRWSNLNMPAVNASISYPAGSMSAVENSQDRTHKIDGIDGSVFVRFFLDDQADPIDFHLALRTDSDNWCPLYESQTEDQLVSGSKSGNTYSYARSLRDPSDGLWTTVLIVNGLNDTTNRPALMASTFQIGRSATLDATSDGHLTSLVTAVIEEHDADGSSNVAATPSPPRPATQSPIPQERFSATGSGFYINENAEIMTNAHVVAGCDSLTVNGEPMDGVATSEPFDLAILAPQTPRTAAHFLSFASKPARLNSDITVAGFPLQGILRGLNITRGSISSTEGLQDATRMQISAPVQPGNSGGPVVDRFGRVVGIVVARLNYEYTKELSGAEPQNINFGIRGAMGAMFAGLNDVAVATTDIAEEKSPEDLADQLREATVLIRCEGSG
ncbi:MAG: serine protease, partial [Sulfitobacter sp.]